MSSPINSQMDRSTTSQSSPCTPIPGSTPPTLFLEPYLHLPKSDRAGGMGMANGANGPNGFNAGVVGGFSFNETRLTQLLSRFDDGVCSFDREPREQNGFTDRRGSFGESMGRDFSRRSSFLSALSLSKPAFPFSSSPSSSSSSSASSSGTTTPTSPHPALQFTQTAITHDAEGGMKPVKLGETPSSIPDIPWAQMGYESQFGRRDSAFGKNVVVLNEEKRHFDPSKEPRLLNIL